MEIVFKVVLGGFFIFILTMCSADEADMVKGPSAELTAREVVIAQLKALQNNDHPESNTGIKIAYNFASPYLKAENGPFSRYQSMYHTRRFNTLIGCSKFFVERHFANDKKAEYFVFVTDRNEKEWVFIFRLSRQSTSPYAGCWMTDSIQAYADARALTGNYFMTKCRKRSSPEYHQQTAGH